MNFKTVPRVQSSKFIEDTIKENGLLKVKEEEELEEKIKELLPSLAANNLTRSSFTSVLEAKRLASSQSKKMSKFLDASWRFDIDI